MFAIHMYIIFFLTFMYRGLHVKRIEKDKEKKRLLFFSVNDLSFATQSSNNTRQRRVQKKKKEQTKPNL